jgi:DNA primase
MNTIDEIKARIDILDLVSETVKLRRSGKNYMGFCPFHSNTRTPAFVVFPESGTWRCFGQCNEGGDIFKYVMKRDGLDFSQALKVLADRAGVQLQPITPKQQAEVEEHERFRLLLEGAVMFFQDHLFHTAPGKQALEYLHKRGLSDATIESFGLGYAPNTWEALSQHFVSQGYKTQDLLDVGLVVERESGGVHDRFRNRITFPIRDGAGKMAGFGARILDPNDMPKFLNSPQTILFDKGQLLYGLDRARKAIRAQDQAVIVEGYLDVIALHQAGFANTVSPMGTALTEVQLRLLKRTTRRIVLALDSDAAGEKATLRGLEIARQALDHSQEMIFDAHGLIRNEARLDADLRVTTLPEGQDPDEIANRDPEEWARIVENAKPIVVHVMETLTAGRDLDDAKIKRDIVDQVMPLIEDVPDLIERDTYRQKLARLLKIDERYLISSRRVKAAARQPRRNTAQSVKTSRADSLMGMVQPGRAIENHCIGILLQRPELLNTLNRKLLQAGLSRLVVQDFNQTDCQTIFHLIQQSLEQDEVELIQFIHDNLPESVNERMKDILAHTPKLDPVEDRMVEDLMRAVIRNRMFNLTERINQLRFLQEEAQQQGELRISSYEELVQEAARLRLLIDQGPRSIPGYE